MPHIENQEAIAARIEEMIGLLRPEELNRSTVHDCFMGSLGIAEMLYGSTSHQVRALLDLKTAWTKTKYAPGYEVQQLGDALIGVLHNMQEEINRGLIRNIAIEAAGMVIGNLLFMAKDALRLKQVSVAAVLASAALEDSLKRKAEELGVNVEGKSLDSVVNALKSRGFFRGAQVPIVTSYVKLRNAAMHADWKKIQEADVSSLVGFLEPFLMEHFA